jgi:lipopolysaccharide transport system ATP-binding protein
MEDYGPSSEVVGRYMSESTSATAEIDLRDYKYRTGSGELKFNWARIKNSDGEVCSKFAVGEDMYLEFEVETFAPLDAARLAVTLRCADGLAVSNMIDMDSGFRFGQPGRKEVLRLKLDDIRLYPDTYYLGFWGGNMPTTDAFDAIDACLSFHIVEGGQLTERRLPRNAGILFLTPEWTRETIQAAA